MKNKIIFMAMLVCLTVAGVFSSCEKENSGDTNVPVERDMLIGKWHLTLYGYTNPPTLIYEYELNRTLLELGEFNEEFSYNQNTIYTEGTWRLDGDNLILTSEGTESVFKIEVLSQLAMVVSTTIDASTIAYYKFEKVSTPDPAQSAFDENGASKSLFSVSATKKVHFSRGNLQYQASSNTWRFAENQYDYLGEDNSYISSTYSGWIDLFGWGTGNNPINASSVTNDYMEYHEWGDNAIVNGGNQAGMWRTLTYEEWQYLFATRTDATSKYGTAIIDGKYKGLVLLPDDWSLPSGISFTAGFKDTGTNITDDFSQNNYTIVEWEKMEEAGALFFPAAGVREGTGIWNVDVYGIYWSSTSNSEIQCWVLWFSSSIVWPAHDERYLGFSVRLVKD